MAATDDVNWRTLRERLEADGAGRYSHVTLHKWLREDPPIPVLVAPRRRGEEYRFSYVAVLEWLAERKTRTKGWTPGGAAGGEGADEIDLRRKRAETELAELKLAEKRGELVNAAELRDAIGRAFANVKTRVLGTAAKLAPRLATATDPAVCQALIYDELSTALADLAGNVITDESTPDPKRGEPPPPAAPEIDRKPMGRKGAMVKPRKRKRTRKVEK